MLTNKTIDRLNQMVDEAIAGTFHEADYNETKLSRLETKWKQFLGNAELSKNNLQKEKDNLKSLISDISHQTKTPVTNIKLYGSLLLENLKNENKEGQEQNIKITEELLRQTEKLEFLMESLTKMSRLESNILEVKPESNTVIQLIMEVLGEITPKAKQKNVDIKFTYEGQGNAYFDKKWTKEALLNVVDNAVKYTPSGKCILISVTEYEMYIAISVKDQGIGIKEEEQAKVFGRFYRAQEVQQEEGVGIGLYLTLEILKKENGYIKVKSQYGKGSEFILYLLKNS